MADLVDSSGLTAHFTGREWVFSEIAGWQAQGSEPSFLLTGEPGTGKSAIAARLVEMAAGVVESRVEGLSEALVHHHFCRARDPRSLEPRRFIEGLSLALCARYEVCAVTAAEQAADVEITVILENVSADSVQGVVINQLHVSEGIGLQTAFDRVVRRPLEALRESGEQAPILILIDSLDEALTLDGEQHIPWLLERVSGEGEGLPEGVRLILTSRPDEAATDHVQGARRLDLILDAPDDVDDLGAYVGRRLSDLPEDRREQLARAISTAGEGNFLYARYLLEDPERDWAAVEDVDGLGLPKGLSGIYAQFLRRRLAATDSAWRRSRRLLGLLAVAQGDGLPPLHLWGAHRRAVPDLGRYDHEDDLDALAQYLAPRADASAPYRLYHRSFVEYVLDGSAAPWGRPCNAEEANGDIARHLLEVAAGDWAGCTDGYVLAHLPRHLRDAGLAEDLYALARDPEFAAAQVRELPRTVGLSLEILRLAIDMASAARDLGRCAEFVLRRAWCARQMAGYSPLGALRAGALERALQLADLLEPERSVLWYLTLAWELDATARSSAARALLDRVVEKKLPSVRSPLFVPSLVAVARLHEAAVTTITSVFDDLTLYFLCGELARSGSVRVARQTAERIADWSYRAAMLVQIATAQANARDQRGAGATLAAARSAAGSANDVGQRALVLAQIAIAQADVGDRQGAQATLAAALAAMERTEDEGQRAVAGAAIAEAQARTGEHAAAGVTLAVAQAMTETIPNGAAKERSLEGIARAQAAIGDRAGALETSESLGDDQRSSALVAVAEVQRAMGAQGAALETLAVARSAANGITDKKALVFTLSTIADALSGMGELAAARAALADALVIAQMIDDPQRERPLFVIARAQATACDGESARETAEAISDEWWRESALAGIANAQAATGHEAAARETVAAALAGPERFTDWHLRASALARIARAQATTGDRQWALKTLGAALGAAESTVEGSLRGSALAEIAEAQAAVGEMEAAHLTAERVGDVSRRASAFASIAQAQDAADDRRGAVATMKLAVRTAELQIEGSWRASALTGVARVQAAGGDREAALTTLAAALDAAGRSSDMGSARARALIGIAEAQIAVGATEAALDILGTALEAAIGAGDLFGQASVLASVARVQAAAGDRDASCATLRTALSKLPGAANWWRAGALVEMSKAQVGAGDREGARGTRAVALVAALRVDDDETRAKLCGQVAAAAAAAGEGAEAMRAYGAFRDSGGLFPEEFIAAAAEPGDRNLLIQLAPLSSSSPKAAIAWCTAITGQSLEAAEHLLEASTNKGPFAT